MRRFVLCLLLGGILLAGGQIILSLGVHPDRLAPLDTLFKACFGMVFGSALVATGLLGLAEGYEAVATRLRDLLGTKQAAESAKMEIASEAILDERTKGFWTAYVKTAGALCLFMVGTLLLAIWLSGSSFTSYLISVLAGIAVWGLLAAALGAKGLFSMRRMHAVVEGAAVLLDGQPDAAAEITTPVAPQVAAT